MLITSRWQTSPIKLHVERTHPKTCSDISVLNNPGCLLVFKIYLTLTNKWTKKCLLQASLMRECYGQVDPTEDCLLWLFPGLPLTVLCLAVILQKEKEKGSVWMTPFPFFSLRHPDGRHAAVKRRGEGQEKREDVLWGGGSEKPDKV